MGQRKPISLTRVKNTTLSVTRVRIWPVSFRGSVKSHLEIRVF